MPLSRRKAAPAAAFFFALGATAISPAFAEAGSASSRPAPPLFELDLAYEYRLGPSGGFLIERTPVKSGIDLMRNFFDRTPLARAALSYGGPEGLSLATEATFRAQWTGNWAKADNLPSSAPGEAVAIENFFITKGVAYWRGGGNLVAFGREKPGYGGILYGSLLPGKRLPYLDALRARGELGSFAVDWMVATIQALRSWESVANEKYTSAEGLVYDVNPNTGIINPYSTDETAGEHLYGFETSAHPTTIVEGLTRFSWEFGALEIGFTDHVMMARRNNRFYLTDFLPISLRHQTAVAQTNNSLIFDLAWRPLPSLSVAAQAGFDDISAEIFGIADTGSPTIDAYVLGAEYRRSGAEGAVDAMLEFGYTHHLWGNYEGSEVEPCDQNPFLRFQYRFLMDSGGALLPLTSPYGPGALWLRAGGGYEFGRSGLRLGAELVLLSKNEEANLVSTKVLYNTTTAAAPRFFFASLTLPVRWRLGSLELSASPSLLVRDREWRPEATFAALYRLRGGAAEERN